MSEELTRWVKEYDEEGNYIRKCRKETDMNGNVKKVCIYPQG